MIKGGANGQRFLEFFKGLYYEVRKKIGLKVVYYLDNCSCHHYLVLKNYININCIHVIFGVPYLSFFNMTEYAFGIIKNCYYNRIMITE
jgi:hypothetical protein